MATHSIAAKELLLQEHQSLSRATSVTKYFGRLIFVSLTCFVVAVRPDEKWSLFVLGGVGILLALTWLAEGWVNHRRSWSIYRSLGEIEEGMYLRTWEDAHIRYGYFTGRLVSIYTRSFTMIEPLLWVWLYVLLLAMMGKYVHFPNASP